MYTAFTAPHRARLRLPIRETFVVADIASQLARAQIRLLERGFQDHGLLSRCSRHDAIVNAPDSASR